MVVDRRPETPGGNTEDRNPMSMKTKEKLDRVYFEEPVVETIFPPRKERKERQIQSLSNTSLAEYINECLMDCRAEGFTEGAVVVKRHAATSACSNPCNWGIVTRLAKWGNTIHDYRPILVQWVAEKTPESFHFMEDLFLIREGPQESDVELMLSLQSE